MIDFSAPMAGMSRAVSQVNAVAARVASPAPQDTVELSQEMVALLSSAEQLKTSAKVVQIADQMNQALLDLAG